MHGRLQNINRIGFPLQSAICDPQFFPGIGMRSRSPGRSGRVRDPFVGGFGLIFGSIDPEVTSPEIGARQSPGGASPFVADPLMIVVEAPGDPDRSLEDPEKGFA